MAESLIQERYQFDFDPGGAVSELERLAKRFEALDASMNSARATGKAFERQQNELIAVEAKILNILNQEVSTYDGIAAKRRVLAATLNNLTKGTATYNTVLRQVQELQRRELNTTEGLNARRKELRAETDRLEKGTKAYAKSLSELNALEKRAQTSAVETTKSARGFATSLAGGLASIGIVVGVQEALRFARESLDASSEEQQRRAALLTALKGQVEVQERLIKQADQVEAATLFDGGDVIDVQRYLASLGLTEKQIQKTINASVQLAAVTGKTVKGATDVLIAAQSGQVRGLAKLVPEVGKLTKAQLASGAAADVVAKKFAGSAEALVTGIAGARNEIRDFSEAFKEGIGDALTTGLGGFASAAKATFRSIAGDAKVDATEFFSEFFKEVALVPAQLLAVVNGTVQVVKALFNGTINNFQTFSNTLQTKYIDLKEALFGGLDTADLLESSRLAGERVRLALEDPFAGRGLTGLIDIFQEGWRDALKDTEQFSKAFSGTLGDLDENPFLPNTKAEISIITGSLADLERQLASLRETVTKSVVATDAAALTPLLQQIEALEKRIAAAKKLQDELINGPKPIEIKDLATTDVQAEFLKAELAKAQIEQQYIRQNSAERLRAIEEEQQRQITAAGVTAEQKKAIEEDFQRRREQLAIETERRIATNALQQKALELQQLESTSKPGENLEGIAKLKADIAELQAQLATLQGKSIDLNVQFPQSAKDKLKQDIKEIADAAVELGQQIIGAVQSIFDAQQARADKAVDYQKSKLDEALENSEDFTAEQVKLERDRLDKLQKQQEQAAQRAKAAQIAQVIANTVIAVSKAAASGGVLAPLTIITTLAAIAAGIGSAVALGQNSFYEGTDFVHRGKNPKGKDTVPAMLHEGEAVLQADVNKAYHPTVKAMRRHGIDPELLNSFVESARGGSQYRVKSGRARLPEYATEAAASGGGYTNQNFYFQAKLGRLEQESERQTGLLQSIAENTRKQKQINRIQRPSHRPERFV